MGSAAGAGTTLGKGQRRVGHGACRGSDGNTGIPPEPRGFQAPPVFQRHSHDKFPGRGRSEAGAAAERGRSAPGAGKDGEPGNCGGRDFTSKSPIPVWEASRDWMRVGFKGTEAGEGGVGRTRDRERDGNEARGARGARGITGKRDHKEKGIGRREEVPLKPMDSGENWDGFGAPIRNSQLSPLPVAIPSHSRQGNGPARNSGGSRGFPGTSGWC